jgi:hypothetical protein
MLSAEYGMRTDSRAGGAVGAVVAAVLPDWLLVAAAGGAGGALLGEGLAGLAQATARLNTSDADATNANERRNVRTVVASERDQHVQQHGGVAARHRATTRSWEPRGVGYHSIVSAVSAVSRGCIRRWIHPVHAVSCGHRGGAMRNWLAGLPA